MCWRTISMAGIDQLAVCSCILAPVVEVGILRDALAAGRRCLDMISPLEVAQVVRTDSIIRLVA